MGVSAEMIVRVSPRLKKKRVKRLAWELGGAFGAERFHIFREAPFGMRQHHALSVVPSYDQDGTTLVPEEGEQFIRVHLSGSYYGKDYERGHLPDIIAIATWLEQRIALEPGSPEASIWYGGDSSGIEAEPFDTAKRQEFFEHFVREGHRPYRRGWDPGHGLRCHCSFCDEPMHQFMFGGADSAGFACDGCGFQQVTKDGGKTWSDENPYKMEKRLAPPPSPDGSTGWVVACLEHPDCRESPELGVSCYLASQKAKRKPTDVPPSKP